SIPPAQATLLKIAMAAMAALFLVIGAPALAEAVKSEPLAAEMADIQMDKTALNDHVIVNANVVRLGDLFTNAGEKAEAAVAYAPEPGQRITLDARWLYRVAIAYKLDWKPFGVASQAVVERDSISIPQEEIKAQILFALADQGITEEMDIEFASVFQQIYLPVGTDPTISVENISYQSRTGRFTAIVAAGRGAAMQRLRLSGRAFRTIDVPVLKARALRGDIIGEGDVQWVRLKSDRVQQDVIIDIHDLIGKTPKRGIRAGTPVRSADVNRPLMVERNSLVMIIHQVPNMTLTAQGKALQSGAEGDVVQIKNGRSNQVVEAEVIGPGRVAVRGLAQQLSMSLN
ncbi:MAG: flagellar basal body P-ring formation chaperone FlgA, partial [Rhodospirillales bacterium]